MEAGALRIVAAVALGLLGAACSGALWAEWLRGGAYTGWRAPLSNAGDLLLMLVLLRLASGRPWAALLRTSGLFAPPGAALRWAAAWALPVTGLALLWLPLADPAPRALFWNALAFPLAEEWLYRGLAMGALMHWAGWRWWTAALLPALAFGLVHWGQGQDLLEGAGVVAVTGAGGLLFGWLFHRWGGNLWPPVLLHAGLNALFMLFDLGHNALLGWEGNALRALAVLLALVLLRWLAPR